MKTYWVSPKLCRIEAKPTKLALKQTRSKRKRSSVSSRLEAKANHLSLNPCKIEAKKTSLVENKELYYFGETWRTIHCRLYMNCYRTG
jgi:hypothetical protein